LDGIQRRPAARDFVIAPGLRNIWMHGNDHMKMIIHDRIRQHRTSKNLGKLSNTIFDPRLAVLEGLLGVRINPTKPRTTYATGHTVKHTGLVGIDDLAAGLGHGCRMALILALVCQA
jgi:hypothetical protein